MKLGSALLLVVLCLHAIDAFLRVQDKKLFYNNDQVFLSGANIAWFNFARDFGSGAYDYVKPRFEQAIDEISNAGGNVIRVWVHIDGQWSPKWDANGFATGEDTPSLINELGQLLDHAAQRNVFVIFTLWDLNVTPRQMLHLYSQPDRLQSYLDKVLKPLVAALKDKPALAAWEVVNEPLASITETQRDINPCFDTTHLKYSGAGWSGTHLLLKDILRFINWHADAIKFVDPKALCTIGGAGEWLTTNVSPVTRDHYTDACLIAAGGRQLGTLDMVMVHTYTFQGRFVSDTCPFKKRFLDYHTTKPMVIEEFSTACNECHDAVANYRYLYDSGYSGALAFQYNGPGQCVDDHPVMFAGMSAIRNLNYNGRIDIRL
ncbi:unnamed protein product [Callosobruchus maculatus]|uniref:Glycoside hydrolase family 5 domain-containing protein n=1 Tax=Callosobruchus maculatus TaxID=64391 RepID=A0A653CPR3_CALMS|nr:unnamed protein product [Callosobruchus maculatus]